MSIISPNQIALLLTEDPNNFGLIFEEYERGTNPNTIDFWRNIRQSNHPFSAHPLLAMYGDESAQQSYDHTLKSIQKAFPQLQNAQPRQIMQMLPQLAGRVFQQIGAAEKPHREELEHLVVQLVSSIWGVPEDILDVKLVDPREMRGIAQELDEPEEEPEEPEEPEMQQVPIDREQVNKRITMNALTQGASVHNMGTIHHAAVDQINQIDPRLIQMYSQLASGSTHIYWIMDFANMSRDMLKNASVGTSKVDFGEDQDPEEEQEYDIEGQEEQEYNPEEQEYNPEADEEYEPSKPQVRVIARAINFPVLIQETIKGVMEVLSMHGLEGLSKTQLASIYQEADALEDEPWLIQVGPQLWRSFLQIVPKDHKLVDIVSALAAQSPEYIHKLLSDTIESLKSGEDPIGPKEALMQLMQQLDDDVDDFDADDYDDEQGGYDDPDNPDSEEDWGLDYGQF